MKVFGFTFSVVPAAMIAATCFSSSQVGAQTQNFELKATHFLPPNHTFHKELTRWGDELAKESNGRLTLKIFPSGQMGPTARQFDLVRTGVADIGVGLVGATPGRFPLTEASNLPFVVSCSEKSSKAITELAPKYLSGEFSGVRLLQITMTPPLKFHMAKAKLTNLSDFKGLRIRYAGELFAESIKAFGATPVAVPPGEVVDAMSKGTVDGAMFPHEGAKSFQLTSAAKYSYEPGINAASFYWIMNPATYEKLPPELRALIDKSTGVENAERIGKILDSEEKEARDYLVGKGMEVVTFPDQLRNVMNGVTKPIIDAYIEKLEVKKQPARSFYDELVAGGR